MMLFRRRLFWKIYLTLLASLVVVAVLMGALGWLIGESPRERWDALRIHLSERLVPERGGAPEIVEAAIGRLGDDIGADVSVYDASGALIGARGKQILLAPTEREPGRMRPPILRVDLADGRVVVARLRPPWPGPRLRVLWMALFVAGGVGLAAFPLTARLTRRLEGLRSGVEQWGAGALSLRIDATGDDEVAVVASAFNGAAARVEELLKAQKALLANASHELRSPLARLRIAVELWLAQPGADLQAEIVRNLAEIDQLVEEILLASRLDHSSPASRSAPVDLLGLAAEEAARVGACVADVPDGAGPIEIDGDATLLRRLIRNLLENAAKHGRPPIEVSVSRAGGKARLIVCDHGPGIAPIERERVFEPFYRPAGRAESAGGWGLGLSLVRQIAKRHGGGVVCEEVEGGGSRFVVELAIGGAAGAGKAS
jgi:signal transduction histidine kinase